MRRFDDGGAVLSTLQGVVGGCIQRSNIHSTETGIVRFDDRTLLCLPIQSFHDMPDGFSSGREAPIDHRLRCAAATAESEDLCGSIEIELFHFHHMGMQGALYISAYPDCRIRSCADRVSPQHSAGRFWIF